MVAFYGWLAVALICAALEMGHPGLFFFLSFACGAVITGLASLAMPEMIVAQAAFFLVATGVSFFFLCRFVRPKIGHHHTNVDALVGKVGVVVEELIDEKPGRVRIVGEVWFARSTGGIDIKEGQNVRVVAVRGAHVVVEAVSN